MNRLDEFLQNGGPIGATLFIEQGLGLERVGDVEQEVAFALEIDAALFELAIEPLPTVQTDANAEGKPTLDSDVTESEAFVLKVVIIMHAAGRFFAGLDQAAIILAETIGGTRFDAGQQSDAARTLWGTLSEFESGGFLVDVGAVQITKWDALFLSKSFGLFAKRFGHMLGMIGKIFEENSLLPKVALHTQRMIEQSRLACKAQAIESGENKENKRPKAR
jgi:hypothetical protein